ncbi:uncharacterized protein E0L32_001023 [Thyridium curvatum]|uniref:C2H2-type domain-containing protein n=1 Tax=Thyridium curvatum TaxID=1093900 RepID=A0A507AKW9_9PEZI|nr:uncharacterized protein E0L32_001023 [Thyridium curvatum]TPX11205.1 hypothetical protein E0L32_001023 [Thyridium curvatum]
MSGANMSSNPRRTPVTRSGTAAANGLTLKTKMVLRKGATFHSPPSSPSSEISLPFRPPPLPRRSQTSLDDVVDAHRRRAALTLSDFDKTLSGSNGSSSSIKVFRDESLPVPRGFLDHAVTMAKDNDSERRVLRPRENTRRPARYHESDSGLGTSVASTSEKRGANKKEKTTSIKSSAITRSAAAEAEQLPGLSPRATNRIYEHTLKPLLSKPSLKDFHPLLLECPRKIHSKEIVCLRDLEKTLLLIAPVSELEKDKGVRGDTYRMLCSKERTKVAELYLEFCITSIRCIQATVEYLSDREQTRPNDLPYTNGYFIDLVDQIRQYAQQLADEKTKQTDKDEKMDVSGYALNPIVLLDTETLITNSLPSSSIDEIKLHGGITVNGRPAELVRMKDGKAISLATGKVVELEEDIKGAIRFKRSASEELADEEEIMRSMARRKKNAPPEEYAPKQCREPGCNKEFKRPCDLTKHEKTHSRPWKCPVSACKYHEYGWPTEKERDRHLNDKHSANPPMYECHFKPCPYKSKRESNCKQHMEKAHGWQYVRTKTNGKARAGSTTASLPTPQLQNIPTPISDPSGVNTPPQDNAFMPLYGNLDFPTYIPDDAFGALNLPQDIHLDYSPIDNATPSTESSLDHSSAYDMGGDFTLYEDIYAAHAQLPTTSNNIYTKAMAQDFAAFSAAELCQPQPAPHISPTGQGNAMLFTPASMADVDEGFDEFPSTGNNGDFILFPATDLSKTTNYDGLFDEIPSMAAGYSQPTSQTLLSMDWQSDYNNFPQHH